MEESRIGYWLMSGVALGLVALVWFVIRKMIDDLWKGFKDMKTNTNTKIKNLSDDVSQKFKINEQDREVLKEMYIRGDVHKIVCEATQNKFLLHVSTETRALSEVLMKEIRSNREAVFEAIDSLRSDMKKNGYVK